MKILVAVDGSKNSLNAARYAADFLEKIPESSAMLLYVYSVRDHLNNMGVELPVGVPSSYQQFKKKYKDYEDKIPEKFSDFSDAELRNALMAVEKIFYDKNIKYETRILEGDDPAVVISDFAKRADFNQIVVGTRGMGGVKGIIMGSVTHKLIQIAPCPLVLVK